MLTKRQKQVLEYIKKYISKNDYAPSLEEIKKHLRLTSVSTAHYHVQALQNMGYLRKEDNQPRALDVFAETPLVQIPILGTIAAGHPIEAIEYKEHVAVPQTRLKGKQYHFALRVNGESMSEENINDGDIVVIQKQPTADNGQKVVALINGNEVTLKKIYQEKSRVRLEPSNPKFKPILVPHENIQIQGVVIDVIKSIQQDKIAADETPKYQKNIPIFKNEKATIYVGDCLECLDKIANGSCRLVFADPPYNMGKKFGNNVDKWDTPYKYKEWCALWVDKCIEKLTGDGSIMIMGHPRYSSYLVPLLDSRLNYVNQIVYYYTDGMPERKNFEKRYEIILYYRKNEKKYIFNIEDIRTPLVRYDKTSNPKGKNPNDVWQIHRVRWNSKERVSLSNGKIAHAAQKPIRLLRRIILATTNEDDLVLDPFLGTGTTAVAAKELNRRAVGIELNSDFAKISIARINNAHVYRRKLSYEER